MKEWVSEELKTLDLGDKRLNLRCQKIVSDLSEHPEQSVPQAIEEASEVQACYEFWSNRHYRANQITEAHRDATLERVKERKVVLAVQDTTELEFAPKKGRRGLGSISKQGAEGLKVHNTLVVSDLGVPLGLIGQKVWAREKIRRSKGYKERTRKIEEKESYRWIESLRATQEMIDQETEVITICDREGDIFELLSEPRRKGSELIIRAAQDRNIRKNKETRGLFEELEEIEEMGEMNLKLQRTPKRKEREAKLILKWKTVEIQPPYNKPNYQEMQPITVQAIVAEEVGCPEGEKAVKWILLATLSIENQEDIQKILKYYTYRWLIERYHYVLKSGCNIEELMLEKGERLEKALATYSIIAWRILWLRYCAVERKNEPATVALEEEEWQVLYRAVNKNKKLPEEIPTIYECVRWIGKLGGFLCRKGDGEPGVKVLWRGIERLEDYVTGWKMGQIQETEKEQG